MLAWQSFEPELAAAVEVAAFAAAEGSVAVAVVVSVAGSANWLAVVAANVTAMLLAERIFASPAMSPDRLFPTAASHSPSLGY